MHFKRVDLLLGLIGIILVTVSSYQLMSSHRLQSGAGIALLETIEQTVKTRQGNDLFWSTPSQGSSLQDNEMIFTAQGSAAKISFDDGNAIEVSESSLVRISSKSLNLFKGELTTKLSGSDLEIKVGNQTLTLKSEDAKVAIQQAGDKTLIGVVSGEVNVVDENKRVVNASSSNIVEVESGKMRVKERMELKPLPAPRARIFTRKDIELVHFGDYPGEIHLSSSKKFKKIKKVNLKASLLPGTYFWRVVSDSHESLIYHFEIIKDHPPQIFRPMEGSILKVELPHAQTFQWENSEVETEIEIVKDHKHIVSTLVKGSLYTLELLDAGEYQWRVRNRFADYKDSLWSPWQKFKVVNLKSDLPQNVTPLEYEVQTYDVESENLDFNWDYEGEVLISIRDEDGKVENHRAKDKFTWSSLRSGTFFVKMKGYENPLDVWTKDSVIRVRDLSQDKNLEVYTVELSRPDQDVDFNWTEGKGDYLFELSRTQDFKDIILSKKVSEPNIKVSIPEIGSYFWRSRILHNGSWRASAPKRIIIKPTPGPQKPKSLPRLKIPLRLKQTSKTLELIPSAFAQANGFVTIDLPESENAKFYRLEIFSDKDLVKSVFKKTSSKPKISWPNARSGVFYYRYSIIDHWDRESESSEASLLEVTTEHLIPNSPQSLKLVVRDNQIELQWEKDNLASFYRLELSQENNFKNAQTFTTSNNFHQIKVSSGQYYLRVKSFNDFGESRFVEKSFKINIKDNVMRESEKNQFYILYRPSMDNVSFTDGRTGSVKGQVLLATELRYERSDNFLSILKADFLTGKVFEGESYQQYSLEGSLDYYLKNSEWKLSLGPSFKFSSLPEFKIEDKVTSSASTQTILGAHLRGAYHEFVFDQYIYISGVSGFLSELSYRKEFSTFHLFSGLAYESIEHGKHKKNSLILKLGAGLSF